jgi:predicted metal-dependent hydrolase
MTEINIADYKLIRSCRRTAAIYIKDGNIEVRAPLNMPKRDIDNFVVAKEQWIIKHLTQSRANIEQRESFTLNYGDTLNFCGVEYPLTAKEGNRVGFDGERFYLPPALAPKQRQTLLAQIYRRLAKMLIAERVKQYAAIMGVMPAAIKINGAKTRWGSCSAKKSLNFSWRLVMADNAVIDYVVVHELAHICEMNHSPRFWAVVAKVLPDYKERQKRLKELQQRLNKEYWE